MAHGSFVEGLWPRGVPREKLKLDGWIREISGGIGSPADCGFTVPPCSCPRISRARLVVFSCHFTAPVPKICRMQSPIRAVEREEIGVVDINTTRANEPYEEDT